MSSGFRVVERGVKLSFNHKEEPLEKVCDCKCHKRPGIRHARVCCGAPKTLDGIKALREYKVAQ